MVRSDASLQTKAALSPIIVYLRRALVWFCLQFLGPLHTVPSGRFAAVSTLKKIDKPFTL